MANITSDGIPAIQNFITMCGFTAVHINNIVNTEGIQDIDPLDSVYLKDVKRMTENLSRLHINRGGAFIGTGSTTNLTALIWLIHDSRDQGLVPDANSWNENVINNARQRMNLELQSREMASEYIAPTKNFDQTKLTDSYLALMNCLKTPTRYDGKRTIDYLVRIDKPLEWLSATCSERLLYGASLTGPSFVQDSQEFYRIVNQWTFNTPAFAWVRPFDKRKDGRGAVATMRAHYNGPGETAKKLAKEEADLKNLHYKNDYSFSFESFVNKLNEIFFIFSESEQTYTPI